MSVNKVKANSAIIKDDYVYITQSPLRVFWFIFGCGIGLATAVMMSPLLNYYNFTTDQTFLYYILLTIFSGAIFLILAGKNIEYQIPKSDVLVIKRYLLDRKVTVVFDDQRMKGLFLNSNEV